MSYTSPVGRALLVAVALGTTTQCTKLPYEPVQILVVEVRTIGSDLDSDGYVVSVDGVMSQPLGMNRSSTFEGLSAGEHLVSLDGLASNCVVEGPHPLRVLVVEDDITPATVTVRCDPLTGSLLVDVITTGTDVDTDGYTVALDGSSAKSITRNGSVTFDDLVSGEHVIELGGIAANCDIVADGGPSPRKSVSITSGATEAVTFFVHCRPPGGALVVDVSTSGTDVDSDGYMITLDGEIRRTVSTNGSVAFEGLISGDYAVELSSVAENCEVLVDTNPNPRSVTVTSGASEESTFFVHCLPTTGTLVVDVTTVGTEVDMDGYLLSIDGETSREISTNGAATFEGLGAGDHTVTLSAVAGNCSVDGMNPREVTVTFGAHARTSFSVNCGSPGDLLVDVMTTGMDLDTDGYMVAVDGERMSPVMPNSSVTFEGLSAGDHTVMLNAVAGNCSVDGTNPRQVTVTSGALARTSFSVTCGAPGGLQVDVTTSGMDLDMDGYVVSVDGARMSSVPSNGSVTFDDLSAGEHTVTLSGIAGNCSVDGMNRREVTVMSGALATTSYSVICDPPGGLSVEVTTTGMGLDPDGYVASIDGARMGSVSSNGSVTFDDVSAGEHTVTLNGIADNCSVNGTNPREVTVISGALARASFSVICGSSNALLVDVTTTGVGLDPDGYMISVDGERMATVDPDGSVLFDNLSAGDHTVTLNSLASNCSVNGINPREVTVISGALARAFFDVRCYGSITVVVETTGRAEARDPDGYTISVNGMPAGSVEVNDTLTIDGLLEEEHEVMLGDVEMGCMVHNEDGSLDTERIRTVTLLPDGTGQIRFRVKCM